MNRLYLTMLVVVAFQTIAFSQDKLQKGASAEGKEILSSPIKALTDRQYTDLKQGNEMNMGLAAELNNYPSPVQVSKLDKELELSPNQKIQLKQIINAWEFKTKEMGRFILAEETKLDNLFSSGKATDGSVIYYSNQIGLFTGELRNAHLQAHLKTRNILTPAQIKKYNTLMGYTN
jgi:hypothetical protein